MKKLIAFFASLALTAALLTPASAANTTTRAFNSIDKYNLQIKGNLLVNGTTTLSTPLTIISAENAIKGKVVTVDIGPTGALTNSTVYTSTTPIGFPCTVIGITLAAHVAPVGGTNTVAVQKNGTTTMLSTATMDPTTLTSLVGKALTLTATPANLTLAATDTIDITYTSGVQTTAANGPVFSIVVVPTTDF